MRKTTAAFMALFALTLVTACGASGGDKKADTTTTTAKASGDGSTTTTTEAAGTGVAVDDWAVAFCGSFKTWISDIQSASSGVSSDVTAGDLASAKTAIVKLFTTASSRTETLIEDVDKAGVPDIDKGDGLVTDLKGKFQDFDDAILAAKSDADALAVDDPTAFKADVQTLLDTFQAETQKVGDSFSELDAKYNSQELNDALNQHCGT
ncbi:MAG: hypothetical protein JWM89_654 [Acidimicrobiales bacterium]|nr:hypothetical protein [Acidimicrobiales bacterium]